MIKQSRAITCVLMLLAACSASRPSANGNGSAGTGLAGSGASGVAGTSGADSSGAGTSCPTVGQVRSCCGGGTQTCEGLGGSQGEFQTWSPCVDSKGATVTCTLSSPGGCGVGEFGPSCTGGALDGGTPTHVCGAGEFGPQCTPPGGDAGVKPLCGAGEFGPQCLGDGGAPPLPKLCTDDAINNEPQILAGYFPGLGQSVGANGQIKVWITDERASFVSAGEQIDPTTGRITTPGDRTGKAADGYLWEPALYIAPATAENGGIPHFPQYVRGWYNNNPMTVPRGTPITTVGSVEVPGMDPAPASARLSEHFNTEDIWDVNALGLAPGTYLGEFVIHDGDRDRGIGCVTITITQ